MSDSRGVGGGSGWGDLTGYQRVSGAGFHVERGQAYGSKETRRGPKFGALLSIIYCGGPNRRYRGAYMALPGDGNYVALGQIGATRFLHEARKNRLY